ncbi:MAG: penicillin-binding protein 2 [Bacteroidetes bacterium]|nr:penicillin-binding protein 2 [Bacteroidota bacterium]
MDNFKVRGDIIIAVIGLVFLIYIGRLFSIQVLSEEYALRGTSNLVTTKPTIPPRGNIYNRKNEIFVDNRPIFKMMITPRNLYIPDTTVLKELLDMSQEEIDETIQKAQKYSTWKESVFARYIKPETYGALQEKMWNFGGFTFYPSTTRSYRYEVGANILGYISEVNEREIDASGGLYKSGDMIGKSGIERSHDKDLRGKQGKKKVLKDVHGREVGSYLNGKYDTVSVKGKDIMLGLDTDLQRFGEQLMWNKKGSIVAIEPSSGEILAFVSAPTYNPATLTGRELQKNWRTLQLDTLNPLFNRPLMAEYPPGSIFKLPVALAALNEGIITEETIYGCGGGFKRNGGKPGCRFHVTPLKLDNAIKYSCNSYFAATYMDFLHSSKFRDIYEAYDTWYRYMNLMGIGRQLNVDMPYEKDGNLPSSDLYDNERIYYGKNRWKATHIISNSIGQGEILMTPLQMANMVAMIANKGKYLPPHFVKATKSPNKPHWDHVSFDTIFTRINPIHFQTVVDAMEQVVASGTARRAYMSDFDVCGKTGTVQNPHGEDHAVFVGFAPKDNPQIAIAVIIENAGGGGRWAAPTASLMIEKYLRGEIKEKKFEENRIMSTNFIR